MSRGRKRKSQHEGLLSEKDMKRAVQQVLIGEGGVKLSLRKGATDNGISFTHCKDMLRNKKKKR